MCGVKIVVIFAITIKMYVMIINVDQIKTKLKMDKGKDRSQCEVRKSFRDVRNASTNEKTDAVHCIKRQSVLRYSAKNLEVPI